MGDRGGNAQANVNADPNRLAEPYGPNHLTANTNVDPDEPHSDTPRLNPAHSEDFKEIHRRVKEANKRYAVSGGKPVSNKPMDMSDRPRGFPL